MNKSQQPNLNLFYTKNRNKVWNDLKNDTIAVLHSNYPILTNGDGELRYIQNNNLMYLCGIKQEETILTIIKSEKRKYKSIIFVKKKDINNVQWNGNSLSHEEVTNISGIKEVRTLSEFKNFFTTTIPLINNIYIALNENPRAKFSNSLDHQFINFIKIRYPLHNLKRLTPIIAKHRMIKTPEEIAFIKKSIYITNLGLKKVISEIRPGIYEFEIEAILSYEFTKNGSRGVAGFSFTPIVAGGKNSCILHYIDNNQIIKPNEILLIDVGAQYQGYNADISRCYPTSGKFSKLMKSIYSSVENVLNETIKLIVPNKSISQYQEEVNLIMKEELTKLGLIKSGESIKPYFMHGISHFLGLDVHDVGDYNTNFQAGMVLTCEPGIYIPKANIGIRLENDILVTESGAENMSEMITINPEEIEKLMANK